MCIPRLDLCGKTRAHWAVQSWDGLLLLFTLGKNLPVYEKLVSAQCGGDI